MHSGTHSRHRAATVAHHSVPAALHHHFMFETGFAAATVVLHPADAQRDGSEEQEKSYDDKKPGDTGKRFSQVLFFELCEQQRAGKNGQEGDD
jgi:hypothetical protein